MTKFTYDNYEYNNVILLYILTILMAHFEHGLKKVLQFQLSFMCWSMEKWISLSSSLQYDWKQHMEGVHEHHDMTSFTHCVKNHYVPNKAHIVVSNTSLVSSILSTKLCPTISFINVTRYENRLLLDEFSDCLQLAQACAVSHWWNPLDWWSPFYLVR